MWEKYDLQQSTTLQIVFIGTLQIVLYVGACPSNYKNVESRRKLKVDQSFSW